MEKYITQDKLIDFNIEKIKRFTLAELSKLMEENLPFCYQLGSDTVVVGRYKVIKISNDRWGVVEYSDYITDFFSRKDAIFYCVASHTNKTGIAETIKNNDSLLGRLEYDAQVYRHRYKQAREQQNSWLIDLYSSKYSEIVVKIDHTKQELKKTISLTKYIKP